MLSQYLREKLTNHLFRSESFAVPAELGITPITRALDDADDGASMEGSKEARRIDNTTGDNSAGFRMQVGPGNFWTPVSAEGPFDTGINWVENAQVINFPEEDIEGDFASMYTASNPFGVMLWGLAILDSLEVGDGNLLFWGPAGRKIPHRRRTDAIIEKREGLENSAVWGPFEPGSVRVELR